MIEKNGREIPVTEEAYRIYFKSFGWKIKKGSKNKENNTDDEWDEIPVKSRKPLSEMSKDELEMLAAEKGISLSGLTNIKQMREALRGVV